MAAGATYEPIATTTLGSAQSSVTFSSISGSYTDLVLVIAAKVTVAGGTGLYARFNSDSTSNYSDTYLRGNGTSATSGRDSNQTEAMIGNMDGNNGGVFITSINNYANTTTYKTTISRTNRSDLVGANVCLWRKTPEAINTIYIFSGGTFAAGSTFTLYGIKAA